MDGRDFYRKVSDDPRIEWLGCRLGDTPAEDRIYIGKGALVLVFSPATILGRDWHELEYVLFGWRRYVLTHWDRIVGYYSTVHSWNRSKRAELLDRQRTPHRVPDRPSTWPSGLRGLPERSRGATPGAELGSCSTSPARDRSPLGVAGVESEHVKCGESPERGRHAEGIK